MKIYLKNFKIEIIHKNNIYELGVLYNVLTSVLLYAIIRYSRYNRMVDIFNILI